MKKHEFSKMKLGEVDFLHCANLKTFPDFNRTHNMTIARKEMGGGVEIRRVA